jgi:HEAT repeat protein
MSCEKVSFILDTKSAADLTAAERQIVDQHLASCDECRETWEAYGELAALRIPATPQHLRARIATALLARAAQRRAHRSFVIGAVLLAGAAVAATAVFRSTNRAPAPAPDPVQTIEVVVPAVQPVVPVAPAAPELPAASDELVPRPREAVESGAEASTVRYALDPYSLVVVVVPDSDADTEAVAALASCHDAVVEQLRGVAGLNVIAGGPVRPFAGSSLPEIQVARELAAGHVLVLRSIERQPSCAARWFNVQTGDREGAILERDDRTRESWQELAGFVAASIRESLLKDAATLMAEARATLLNEARSDLERAEAMFGLRQGPDPPPYDEAIVAAVVEIGMRSREANARATGWFILRGVTDPSIVQPLLYALANDEAENVRSAAALTLAPFRDQPAVRDALTRAAAEIPSERPTLSCCEFTVRSAARLAMRAGDVPTDAVRKTVLDESLTPQERLMPLTPDGKTSLRLDQLGDEAAQAVFALGLSVDDHEVRARAWSLLGDVREPRFIPALVEDLAQHPVESVRIAAAAGLRQHRDDPDVRAVLERATADPSLQIQRAARNALDGVRVVGLEVVF